MWISVRWMPNWTEVSRCFHSCFFLCALLPAESSNWIFSSFDNKLHVTTPFGPERSDVKMEDNVLMVSMITYASAATTSEECSANACKTHRQASSTATIQSSIKWRRQQCETLTSQRIYLLCSQPRLVLWRQLCATMAAAPRKCQLVLLQLHKLCQLRQRFTRHHQALRMVMVS